MGAPFAPTKGLLLVEFTRQARPWGACHVMHQLLISTRPTFLDRDWSAGAGSGCGPLTIGLNSTICATSRLAKEGARHHNYAGAGGCYPLLAIASVTGDVLMARLGQGRADTARSAAHCPRETVGSVRYAGGTGPLTVRADSDFYTHAIVSAWGKMDIRFSITIRQHKSLRNIIEATTETDWTLIPAGWRAPLRCPRPRRHHSRANPTPSRGDSSSAGSSPSPVASRRCSPPTAITPSSPTVRATLWNWRPSIAMTQRWRTPSVTSSTPRGSTISHQGASPPTPHRWPQVVSHKLARWTALISPGEALATTKTLRRRFFFMAGRFTRKAPYPESATGLAPGNPVQRRSGQLARPAAPYLATPTGLNPPPNRVAGLR